MQRSIENFCEKAASAFFAREVVDKLRHIELDTQPTLHPYGFYIWKINIPDTFGFSLRLHAWLPEERTCQKPEWPAHNHHLDLHSLALRGHVANHEWDWRPSPTGDRALYSVGYEGNVSLLNRTAETGSLTNERIETIGPLQDYVVPSQQYHASRVAEGSAAVTLVLFSTRAKGSSRVVGERSGAARYAFDRQEVDPRAAERARRLVMDCLSDLRTDRHRVERAAPRLSATG